MKDIQIQVINSIAGYIQDYTFYKNEENFNKQEEIESIKGSLLLATDIVSLFDELKELELIFDKIYYKTIKGDDFLFAYNELIKYVKKHRLENEIDRLSFDWVGDNFESNLL